MTNKRSDRNTLGGILALLGVLWLILMIAMIMTGCRSADPQGRGVAVSSDSSKAYAASSAAYLTALAGVNPVLANNREVALENAQRTCTDLAARRRHAEPNPVLDNVVKRYNLEALFSGKGARLLAADKIVKAVNDSGICGKP